MQTKLIGFLSLKESLADAVIGEINGRNLNNIRAEQCLVDPVSLEDMGKYSLIVDRISHVIAFYSPYLKHAAVNGTYVINNPFWVSADDKFYNYSIAKSLGLTIPRTVCLPSLAYPPEIDQADLHNFNRHTDWKKIFGYIGFPAILKPYDGHGGRSVFRIENERDFFKKYEMCAGDVMMLQQYIEYEHYIRCLVIGREHVLPIRYDPTQPFGGRQYIVDHNHLSPVLGEKILRDCRTINRALGYDMNSIEFAIKDGVPYAVDFMNPVPDTEPERISEEYFRWVTKKLADVTVEYVSQNRKILQYTPGYAFEPEFQTGKGQEK